MAPIQDDPTPREYFELLFKGLNEKFEAYKTTGSQALDIASNELARRLEALNGEAGRLAKMQDTYYPRQVAEPRLENLDAQIRALQMSKAALDGKASQNSFYLALFFSVMGLMSGMCSLSIALFGLALRLYGI